MTMNGPSEFHVTGTLRSGTSSTASARSASRRSWSPAEHDEATPAINRTVSEGIPGARSVVYPDASHMAHVEGTGRATSACSTSSWARSKRPS